MFETIEKLKETKTKLTTEFEENRREYKAEIKKIDKAIKKFSEGYAELGDKVLELPAKRGMSKAIETILADGTSRHISQVIVELERLGFSPKYQSVSSILQVNSKQGGKFIKILPATYVLRSADIPNNRSIDTTTLDEFPQSILFDNDDFDF